MPGILIVDDYANEANYANEAKKAVTAVVFPAPLGPIRPRMRPCSTQSVPSSSLGDCVADAARRGIKSQQLSTRSPQRVWNKPVPVNKIQYLPIIATTCSGPGSRSNRS